MRISDWSSDVCSSDLLYREDGKLDSAIVARDDFVGDVTALLENIQQSLHDEARARMNANIDRSVTDFAGVEAFFAKSGKYRSEERRVGEECVSTRRSEGSRYN